MPDCKGMHTHVEGFVTVVVALKTAPDAETTVKSCATSKQTTDPPCHSKDLVQSQAECKHIFSSRSQNAADMMSIETCYGCQLALAR